MQVVELNPPGHFDPWEPTKLRELQKKQFPETLGHKLLFENDKVRFWELELEPGERLPFRAISRAYNWVALSEGLAIKRCGSGSISMLRFKIGESAFFDSNGRTAIHDFENIGENRLLLHLTEFKLDIENISKTYGKTS